MNVKILWLYPNDMSIYGDYGNVLVIEKRLRMRGVDSEIIRYNPGDVFPDKVDLVLGGGGQDSGQSKIKDDLTMIALKLRTLANAGVPMLMVCGLYQLFGDSFTTNSDETIPGIGIFEGLKTIGGNERMIGNIIESSDEFGEIIGYENHSGKTYIGENEPLAKVIMGSGNNPEDGFEGAIYKNVIGTYLHGSVLPKNPQIADFLIKKSFENKKENLPEWSDLSEESMLNRITEAARQNAKKRPR